MIREPLFWYTFIGAGQSKLLSFCSKLVDKNQNWTVSLTFPCLFTCAIWFIYLFILTGILLYQFCFLGLKAHASSGFERYGVVSFYSRPLFFWQSYIIHSTIKHHYYHLYSFALVSIETPNCILARVYNELELVPIIRCFNSCLRTEKILPVKLSARCSH